jgi:polysaccharide biosynthesis/export protein
MIVEKIRRTVDWMIVFSLCIAFQGGLCMIPSAWAISEEAVFVLGPGDELEVSVWEYPEFSGKGLVVLPDGTLTFPVIGPLGAGGRTVLELTKLYETALDPYVELPQVTLKITQMRSRHFTIMGAVKKPGLYPLWQEKISLLEAVTQAGGIESEAMKEQVKLFRANGQGGLRINLNSFLEGRASQTAVELGPGDVLFIPSLLDYQQVSVLGKVNLPGRFPFKSGMSVIDAFRLARGTAETAAVERVLVVRYNTSMGQPQTFQLDARLRGERGKIRPGWKLEPGDLVFVPSKGVLDWTVSRRGNR